MARLVLILFLFVPLSAFSQGRIFGRVTDSANVPVPYAIVALLNANDSSVVTGTPSADNGEFAFANVSVGNYLMRIAATGFDEFYSTEFRFDSLYDLNLPVMVLRSAAMMNGVTVTAVRPTFEFKNGNTIVNIENTALAKGNSVYDLLPKLPGVSVDKNVISIQGKSGVVVMIDSRVQQVSDEQLINLLKSMSAESVERIEILRNPPVKYDASGTSGMINIITKKNAQQGFSGGVFASTAQGFYNNSSAGLSLNYRDSKVAFFSSVNADDGWFKSDDRHYRLFTLDSGITQMNSANHWKERQRGFNFRVGADWFVKPDLTIGFKVDGGPGAYTSYGTGDDYVLQNNDMGFDHLNTINYIPNKWSFVNYNINTEYLLDTIGSRWSFSADYSNGVEHDRSYSENYYYDVNSVQVFAPNLYRNSNEGSAGIIAAKTDYLKIMDSVSSFEAGMKFSSVSTSNDYILEQRDTVTGIYLSNSGFSNNYDYAEQTYAAYLNYSRSWKKVGMQLGIRGEQTLLNGHNRSSGYTMKRSYFSLFPNLNFSYTPNEKHEFQLTLTRRVDRPAFDDLNPFVYYLNPFSYYRGNPFLQPDYGNTASITHSFKGIIVNTFSYERINAMMLNYTFQDDSTRIFYQNITNADFQNAYVYSLFIQQDFKSWWSCSVMGDFMLMDFKGEIGGVPFRTYGMNYNVNMMNTIILPNQINFELMGMYRGPNLYGITSINPVWMVSAAVKKTFFDEKLSCTIGMDNIFNSMKFHTHAQFDNQDWNYYVVNDNRRINLSMSYNFGKAKVEDRGVNSNEEEKGRLDM